MLYEHELFRATTVSASPTGAVSTWCSIPSAAIFESSMRCIAWGARLLVIGFTAALASPAPICC